VSTAQLTAAWRVIRPWADMLLLALLIVGVAFLPRGLPFGIAGLGIVSGAAIAVQAMGLVLVYRATRIINFAQVALGLVSTVLVWQFVKHLQLLVVLHWSCNACVPGIPAGSAGTFWNLQNHPEVILRALATHHAMWMAGANFWVSMLIGLYVGIAYTRQLGNWTTRFWQKAPRLVPTVASLGFATALAVFATFLLSAGPTNPREANFDWDCFGACKISLKPTLGWWPYDDYKGIQGVFRVPYHDVTLRLPFDSSGTQFHLIDLEFVALAVLAAVGIVLALKFTRLGVILRGVADNQERAQTLGIDIRRSILWAWLIAGFLSVSVALIQVTGQPPNLTGSLNIETLTRMFAVVVFARMSSIPMVLAAAFGLGIIDEGLFWNYSSHAPFFLVQLGVIAVALLVQRRKLTRAQLESAVAWLASPEIRPTPRALRRLPLVRNWISWATAIGLIALLVLPLFLEPGQVTLTSIVLVYAIIGLSVFVLTGWAGQISLGQMALAAAGGFVAVMLYQKVGIPMPVALLLGALAGTGVAVVIGFPGLRLPGPYLAVVTIAVATTIAELVVSSLPPSLGQFLPRSIERPLLLGLDLNDERIYYYFALVVLALATAMVVGLRRSRLRRALIAARDNDPAAQSFGINIVIARLEAFAVSGFLAALAGGLLAFEERGVNGSGFDPTLGLQQFLVVVIGGVGSLAGPLIGSIYFGGFSLAGDGVAIFAIGGGVIAALIWAPDGLGGLLFKARDAILRRIAIRNRISAPSLLAEFTSTAQGTLRAQIAPNRRNGHEPLVETRFELTGGGPGPVAGTYLEVVRDGEVDSKDSPPLGGGVASRSEVEGDRAEPLLQVRELEVRYDSVQALFKTNLEVRAGEIVAVVGTNGAGKTTLLRAIAGLHQASKGAVLLDGADVTRTEPHIIARKGVGLVPGGAGAFPSLTVVENLRVAGWQAERLAGAAGVDQVLDHFPRLRERLDAEAGNLSGGEQQMLALAQAFLVRPRLLLIDELSMGLAPQVIQTILEQLRQLRAEGTAIVIVEQSLNLSMTVADRAVLLEKGEVRYTGPARELLDHPELFQSISFGAGGVGTGGGSEVARRRKAFGETVQTALEVTGVTASYGGVTAVRDVTLQLNAGEVVGLIGPNGAGKTTLFDVISGFHRPDSGTVAVLGTDVTGLAPYARAQRGLMRSFQNVRLFPSLTVRDNIATALERHIKWKESIFHGLWLPMGRDGERKAQARVDMLVELLELGPYVDRTMGEVSIGTRRIVDIACQLAARPRVLLLDEPSSGLAQVETEQLGPIIARIAADLDAAILVIEHDIPLISAIATRLIALDLGSVIAEGAPREVLSNERVKEAYFGGAAAAVIARSGRGDALPA